MRGRREEAYLAPQTVVSLDVAIGAIEGLLQEGEQDGDNNDGLNGLSEDDQEDGHRKDIDSHGEGCCGCRLGSMP